MGNRFGAVQQGKERSLSRAASAPCPLGRPAADTMEKIEPAPWRLIPMPLRLAHDLTQICGGRASIRSAGRSCVSCLTSRSEEHTSELQSLMRISYAVFCLKKKNKTISTKQP